MFKTLPSKPDFNALELAILNYWKEKDILNRSINARSKLNTRSFYDGPITANGDPHYGHTLTFTMKDIFPRYWTMQGYNVNRSLGWDCQGLPVEIEIEKLLGINKSQIEEYGIAKFNAECKKLVEKYRGNLVQLEERMGRLTNNLEEYATMDADYIESIWWSLAELYKKGLLYEGNKVMPYSTGAGTSLSAAEVSYEGYKPITDPAVTVKFKLKSLENTYLLAWTTTPWTLPSNVLLSVGKEVNYSKVKVGSEYYILATNRIKDTLGDIESVESVDVNTLIGQSYEPLFAFQKSEHAQQFTIVLGGHVTDTAGTGIVHLAPYGIEDAEILKSMNLPVIDVLDDVGRFLTDFPSYAGMFYKKANEYIIQDLTASGLMLKHEAYTHDMPICWRTGVPLIYKPIKSWYIAMTQVKDNLVANNDQVNWVPNHVKEGRFGNWLKEVKDWAISRKRYWGTPLPIWKSATGKVVIIESFAQLEKLSGVLISDPHRPFVDEIKFTLDGEEYTRVTDVLDVWYDSGAMPFARFHYPFENKDKFEQKFPAEYIAEGIDQTRGWFYSLMAIGTAVFGAKPYKNVVVNGFIVDEKGAKLSKSKKNYAPLDQVLASYGADALRLNFLGSPITEAEDGVVTEATIKQQIQEYILPLWNCVTYLSTYANMHQWVPSAKLARNVRLKQDPDANWNHIPFDELDNELDAWIVLQLQQTITEVTKCLDAYYTQTATKELKKFMDSLSKWYIRRSRDRYVAGEDMALSILYYSLVEYVKILAPFAPYISDYVYQYLVSSEFFGAELFTGDSNDQAELPESVHLTDYPVADSEFIATHAKLNLEMELVQQISELGQSVRVSEGLKVRQPLQSSSVMFSDKLLSQGANLSMWMKDLIAAELNVLTVQEVITLEPELKTKNDGNIFVGINTEITPELELAGTTRELIRQIQSMRKTMGLSLGDKINISYSSTSTTLISAMESSELRSAVSAELVSAGEATNLVTIGEATIAININKV